MSEDLHNYKLQLQQVEAALFTNPNNKELEKLKRDLYEVIELTLELQNKSNEAATQPEFHEVPATIRNDEDEIAKTLLTVQEFVAKTKKKKLYRVGDVCLAKWSGNNQYYAAHINSISPDGQVNVTFDAYKSRGITTLVELKEFIGEKRQLTEAEKVKRVKLNNDEYLKQKKIKKAKRLKELEEEHEAEKNKWLAFKVRATKAKKVGLNGKSIFASPELVDGRVGIGTCGISGRPMTQFSDGKNKRRK